MCGTQLECRVVTLLALLHQPLLLEGVGQVAVGIREVRLQLDGSSVGINGEVDETLLIVNTGEIAMDDGMIR